MKDVTGMAVLVSIICSVIGIAYALYLTMWVLKRNEGNEKMRSIAQAIQEGARAYLNRQYRTVAAVAGVIAVVLWLALDMLTAIGFLIGAAASALAGYVGMHMAVRANIRTAQDAHDGLDPALRVAFRGGAVTGLLLIGLGLLSVAGFYAVAENIAGQSGHVNYDTIPGVIYTSP